MSGITTCTGCARLYVAGSEEEANSPSRLCWFCIKRAKKHPGKCRCELCRKLGKFQQALPADQGRRGRIA